MAESQVNGTTPDTSLDTTIDQGAQQFDAGKFLFVFFELGIPYVITLLAAAYFLHKHLNYNISRVKSWLAGRFSNPETFKTHAWWMSRLIQVALLLIPYGLLFAWGIVTATRFPPAVVGIGIIFGGIVLATGGHAIAHWYSVSWRMTRTTLVLLSIAFLMCCVFEIAITMLVTPFSFIGFAAVFVAFNLFPMVYIVYLNVPRRMFEFGAYLKTQNALDASADLDFDIHFESSRKFRTIVAYACAITPLIVHGALHSLLPSAEGPNYAMVGFYVLFATLVLDATFFLYHASGMLRNPVVFTGLLIVSRGIFIGVGAYYWFLGHSAVYLITAVVLGISLVDSYLPYKDHGALGKHAALVDPANGLVDLTDDTTTNFLRMHHADNESAPAQGIWVYLLRREFILAFLTIAFVIDLILTAVLGKFLPLVQFPSHMHPQFLVGVGCLILAFIIPLAFSAYRLYQRNNYNINRECGVALMAMEIVVVGSGVIFYFLSDSYIVLMCSIFLPPMLVAFIITYFQWMSNDYFILSRTKDRKDPEEHCLMAFCAGHLLTRDYRVIFGTAAVIALDLALAISIASLTAPAFVGWTIAVIIGIPLLTCLPVIKYFNHFVIDKFVVLVSLLAQALLIMYCLLMHYGPNHGAYNYNALGLLFLAVLYPTLTIAGVAITKWRDDKWKVSRIVVIALIFSAALILSVIIVVLVVFDRPLGFGLLFVYVVLAYIIASVMAWVTHNYILPPVFKYTGIVIAIAVILIGVAVGVIYRWVFAGFTVSWGIIFAVAALWALGNNLRTRANQFQYSHYIFPVYEYVPERDEIRLRNRHVAVGYVAIFFLFIWGICASMFLRPYFIGFGVSSFGLVLFVWYTIHLLWTPSIIFGHALAYVSPDLLAQARKTAREKSVGVPNQLATDGEVHELNGGEKEETAREKMRMLEAKEAQLARGETTDILASYRELLTLDAAIDETFHDEQRFAAIFQFLTVMLTDGKRRAVAADIRDMMSKTGYQEVTVNAIERWNQQQKDEFKQKFQLYLAEKSKKSDDLNRKAQEDVDAAARRAAMMRDAEERRRQAQMALEQQTAEEEERMRREQQAEADRQRREQQRQAEERRRLEQIQEDAERRRREARLRADQEAEAKRQADEQARQAAAAARLAASQQALADQAANRRAMEAAGGFDVHGRLAQLNGGQFNDIEFPPNDNSLYINGVPQGDASASKWMRPKDFVRDAHPIVFDETIEPSDISQGALGDCWFLSAISVLSLHPERLRKVFLNPEPNPSGLYALQFYKNGKWQTVVVDDKFPCTRSNKPAYACSKNENELWVMLIEKAYAKLHHSYAAIEGGLVNIALVDLTGGSAESINLERPNVQQDISTGRLWSRLMQYQDSGYLMGAGSPTGSDRDVSDLGIVQGHAYALLNVQSCDGHSLLQLRNPWGRGEWKGDWSDDSPLWTTRMKTKLGFTNADDGSFWISFEDFVVNFRNIYVCRTFSSAWSEVVMNNAWDERTAGGCTNFETAVNNPQFHLTVSRPTNLFLVLAQDDGRLVGREPYSICLIVADKKGKRVKKLYKGETVASSGPYINQRDVSCEVTLEPRAQPYTIMVCTFNPGEKCGFALKVNSDVPVTLALIPPTHPAD